MDRTLTGGVSTIDYIEWTKQSEETIKFYIHETSIWTVRGGEVHGPRIQFSCKVLLSAFPPTATKINITASVKHPYLTSFSKYFTVAL